MRVHLPLGALLLATAACSSKDPLPVVVHVPASLSPVMRDTATQVADELRSAGATVWISDGATAPCTEGEVHLVITGPSGALDADSFAIDDDRCGDGRVITTRGGGLLPAQQAPFVLLEALGFRFFHPEHTLRPLAVTWPERDLSAVRRPWMSHRTIALHRTHPVELSAPLDPGTLDMAAYQKRWIDWNLRLGQTEVNGWDFEFVGPYAYDRGFPRGGGFNLLNSQQGGRPILDPDDPRPEETQLAEAIDAQLVPVEGLPPITRFGFQFNPSEFTEANDRDTVRRLTFITEYLTENHPQVKVSTINHGTAGKPTEHYGVRFFDLSQFAPPELGVSVHTLMFYDLSRPAPVYGNQSFQELGAWMKREATRRRVVYYPEASWWLTFDLPVPLFLAPVTLEARQHDLDELRPLFVRDPEAKRGLIGHRTFSSGHEWGYWLIDYCVSQMLGREHYTHRQCLEDFTGQLAHGDEIYAVWLEVERRQITDLRDPELIRYLVGSDDETEVALAAGIDFHPLPPQPAEVLAWDDGAASTLEEGTLPRLRAMAEDYRGWARRIEATLPAQDDRQAPFAREIHDGLEIFALRAEHAAEIYQTTLDLRRALAAKNLELVDVAHAGLERARALTEEARRVVRRREADYRYPPELTIAGDEPGTPGAIPNQTIYPYRYLGRTHRLFYWERPDTQLAALFGEGVEQVRVSQRILELDQAAEVLVLAPGVEDLRIDWGDGTISTTTTPHRYARQGFYSWSLDAQLAQGILHHEDQVAVVERRLVFPKKSLKVKSPTGGGIIEGLLPGFEVGLGDDGAPFWAIGRIDGAERVASRGTLLRRSRSGDTSGPESLTLELKDVGAVTVHGARLALVEDRLVIEGDMVTQEIIDLLVGVGGFEPEGARTIVAGVLEYTPETLPARIPFRIEARAAALD